MTKLYKHSICFLSFFLCHAHFKLKIWANFIFIYSFNELMLHKKTLESQCDSEQRLTIYDLSISVCTASGSDNFRLSQWRVQVWFCIRIARIAIEGSGSGSVSNGKWKYSPNKYSIVKKTFLYRIEPYTCWHERCFRLYWLW